MSQYSLAKQRQDMAENYGSTILPTTAPGWIFPHCPSLPDPAPPVTSFPTLRGKWNANSVKESDHISQLGAPGSPSRHFVNICPMAPQDAPAYSWGQRAGHSPLNQHSSPYSYACRRIWPSILFGGDGKVLDHLLNQANWTVRGPCAI